MGKGELKVAVFECDHLQVQVQGASIGDDLRRGAYTQLVRAAFRHVLANAPKILHPQITVPPIISFVGIRELDRKKVKTVGIGFGHQAIAQALGGQVARNPKGFELSVRKALVTNDGQQVFLPSLTEFRLHYYHNDAILKLPPDFLVLASNNVTEFQSIYKQQQFLTFCGHPDFSYNVEALAKLLEYDREKLLVPEQLVEHAFTTLSQPTEYEWAFKQILLFHTGFLDEFPRPHGRAFHN